jgi:hypothetical protein
LRKSALVLLLAAFSFSCSEKTIPDSQTGEVSTDTTSILQGLQIGGYEFEAVDNNSTTGLMDTGFFNPDNAEIDSSGFINLIISGENFEGAEIISKETFPYGTAVFFVKKNLHETNSAVKMNFEIFTEDSGHSGMFISGIELSGIENGSGGINYYTKNTETKGAADYAPIDEKVYEGNLSTHSISIFPGEVSFASYQDHGIDTEFLVADFTASDKNPFGAGFGPEPGDRLLYNKFFHKTPEKYKLRISFGLFFGEIAGENFSDTLTVTDFVFYPLDNY